mgnify:CR=1 FL=1
MLPPLTYFIVCIRSLSAPSTAVPICCMVLPTQVFMALRFSATVMPMSAPATMPAAIPRQNAVSHISITPLLTRLFCPRKARPYAAIFAANRPC